MRRERLQHRAPPPPPTHPARSRTSGTASPTATATERTAAAGSALAHRRAFPAGQRALVPHELQPPEHLRIYAGVGASSRLGGQRQRQQRRTARGSGGQAASAAPTQPQSMPAACASSIPAASRRAQATQADECLSLRPSQLQIGTRTRAVEHRLASTALFITEYCAYRPCSSYNSSASATASPLPF